MIISFILGWIAGAIGTLLYGMHQLHKQGQGKSNE